MVKKRNLIIGKIIGRFFAYALKGLIYEKAAIFLNAHTSYFIYLRVILRQLFRLIRFTSENYLRTDFSAEVIFSDAIDAVFFAD
jgi:hypothetical protein